VKQWRTPEEMSQTLLTNMKQGSEEIHFLRYKIIGAPKFKKQDVSLYLGLELTMHILKSEIHLVRQFL
jgi:hypothetical protein